MTLAHDIANVAQELQLHATGFCEAVHQLRDDMTLEEIHTELALLRMTAISMRTQAHTLAAYVAAAKMTGHVAPLPPLPDLKSRAANDNTLTLSLQ
jgi:hypothetical protein